jgi:hypothetical protein
MTGAYQNTEASSYVEFWGKQQLQRWPASAVQATSLPPSLKAFLIEVGMPPRTVHQAGKGFALLQYFNWNLDLSPVGDAPSRLILATFCELPIVIDEGRQGHVIRTESLPTANGLPGVPERLYNSSVEQFAFALTEDYKRSQWLWPYLDPHKDTRNLAEEQAKDKANIDAFEARLVEIDPLALADPNSYWSHKIFATRCEVDDEYASGANH